MKENPPTSLFSVNNSISTDDSGDVLFNGFSRRQMMKADVRKK